MKLVKEKKLKFHLELLDCDNTMISLTFHFCIPVHLEFNASLFILNPNFSFLSSPFTSIRRLHHHFFGPLTLLSFPFSLIFFFNLMSSVLHLHSPPDAVDSAMLWI